MVVIKRKFSISLTLGGILRVYEGSIYICRFHWIFKLPYINKFSAIAISDKKIWTVGNLKKDELKDVLTHIIQRKVMGNFKFNRIYIIDWLWIMISHLYKPYIAYINLPLEVEARYAEWIKEP